MGGCIMKKEAAEFQGGLCGLLIHLFAIYYSYARQ